ncbi:MAG TPA: regulatory protein RecX [Steroidobacteraceae bacterium]|nr:regulatory protein RecX [Steroidobacteraceae bacterium]
MRLQAKRARQAALEPEEAVDPRAIREAALGLLARRDHATRELERKLEARGFETQAIAAVLTELAARRFLDDERYVEHFVSYHAGRGQGPIRIAAELRQLSLPAGIIDRHLDAVPDWPGQARAARRKKFGAAVPKEFRARAKQARFLEYRGFSAEHVRAALEGEVAAED